MLTIKNFPLLSFFILGTISCKKETTSSLLNEVEQNAIKSDTASSIIVDKDTTIISFGDIVIRYTQTSACYPSTEVFSFSVKATTRCPLALSCKKM